MPASWSPRRDVSRETSRLLIERAHEEFVSGNLSDPRIADVREIVRESWGRSLALVGAEQQPPLELTDEELEAYRSAHPLAGVMDMVRALLLPGSDAGADSGVVVAVGDAAGRLLWVEGDHGIRTLTGDMGFVAGANWSEAAVGTSAPGTALAIDRSVQIDGAEHFNRFVQPWSCTAAPVHDPETRHLLGVIDVTGGGAAVTPQAQLLVDATARAVEGELLIARLRERERSQARSISPRMRRNSPRSSSRSSPASSPATATLHVLGRDTALLDLGEGRTHELSARHAEILLLLLVHREGLSAERLAEMVYGTPSVETIRPEMVRLRRVLDKLAPHLAPASRPYRLTAPIESDAQRLLSLLGRGAHRIALGAYPGAVMPASVAPGIEEFRSTVRATLRESVLAEGSVDTVLAYLDTEDGADDRESLDLALRLLPARSPKRAAIVARIERLDR